ncbi:MAG: DnaD domain protein [Clostridia bacterium]|nr:DnaD domain protein [Clostridia bacterium]
MATGKRYYWIKLRETFMTSDTVDFLMSQKDGANYVVLYQMLCLKTINTGGRLSRTIGEIVIPYDVEKIQRDCKWFSADTIRVALNLYKRFGLIYEERDGTLVLADHDRMVGSETDWAQQKRDQLKGRDALPPGARGNSVESGVENFHTDIRDKDIRDKRPDIRDQIPEKENGSGGTCSFDTGNPFGDYDPHHQLSPDTLEAYASANLRNMTLYNMEELTSFRDSLPDELIRHAIDEACGNGVPVYNYVRSILNRYVENGFKTLGDVKAYEEKRRNGGTDQKPYADENDFY